MKNAKENWIQDQCSTINDGMSKGRANKKCNKNTENTDKINQTKNYDYYRQK